MYIIKLSDRQVTKEVDMNAHKQDVDRATGAQHHIPPTPNSYNPVNVNPSLTLVMFVCVLVVGAIVFGLVYYGLILLGVQS